jgi:hypothetical protein
VVVERLRQGLAVEDVDAHRGQAVLLAVVRLEARLDVRAQGVLGDDRRILGLLDEFLDGEVVADLHQAELVGPGRREGNGCDRDVGLVGAVRLDDLPEIHPVELVAGKDQDELVREGAEVEEVPADGVGRALVPLDVLLRLLGREDVDEPAAEGVEDVGRLDVAVERGGVELRQDEDPVDLRIQAIADRDIHQAVLAGERHRRLATFLGERGQARAAAAAHDHRQYAFLDAHAVGVSLLILPKLYRHR